METNMETFYRSSCFILMCFGVIACFGLIPDCPSDLEVALYDVAYSCVSEVLSEPAFDTHLTLLSMTNISYWNKYCRYWKSTKPCLLRTFNKCPPEYVARILNGASSRGMGYQNGFSPGGINDAGTYDKMCDRGFLKYNIVQELKSSRLRSCLHSWHSDTVLACYVKLVKEMTFLANLGYNATVTSGLTSHIFRWEQSTYQCILSGLDRHCNGSTRSLLLEFINITIPNVVQLPATLLQVDDSLITYGRQRLTTGIYSSGHMLIDKETTQTCMQEGNIVFIHNQYYILKGISISVLLNESMRSPIKAYLINQISIDFLGEEGHRLGTYVSQDGGLPSSFVGGDDSLSDNSSAIFIKAAARNNSIIIVHQRSESVFIIYEWQQYYGILLRTTDMVLKTSYGQLISGCSLNDLYSGCEHLSVNACSTVCMESHVHDLTEQQMSVCLYDCAVLGEQAVNMTLSMIDDLDSIRRMDHHIFHLLQPVEQATSATYPHATSNHIYMYLFITISYLVMNMRTIIRGSVS